MRHWEQVPSDERRTGDLHGPEVASAGLKLLQRTDSVHESPRTGIVRNYGTVFAGHAVSAFLALITSIFLARTLQKDDFGVYSAFVAMSAVFAALVDCGINSSLVRFGSRHHGQEDQSVLSDMIRASILWKMVLGAILGTAGLIVISVLPIGDEIGDWKILLLAPVSGLGLSFFFMTQSLLQIQRSFPRISLLLVAKGCILLALLAGMAAVAGLNLLVACSIFLVSNAAAVGIFFRITPRVAGKRELGITEGWKHVRVLLNFGKWIAVSTVSFTAFEQLPLTIALGSFGPSITAEFSVAIALVGMISIVGVPLLTILMPDLSRIKTKQHLIRYLSTAYRLLIPLATVIIIATILLAGPVIKALYGAEYVGAASILRILVFPFVLSFLVLPVNAARIYVFNQPHVGALTNVIQLIALAAAIPFIDSSGDLVILAAIYGLIRATGTLGVTLTTIRIIRSGAPIG